MNTGCAVSCHRKRRFSSVLREKLVQKGREVGGFPINRVLHCLICSDSRSHSHSELFVLRHALTSHVSLPLSFFLLRASFSTVLTWKTAISSFPRSRTVLPFRCFLIPHARKKKSSHLCVPILPPINFCFVIFHKIIVSVHFCLC